MASAKKKAIPKKVVPIRVEKVNEKNWVVYFKGVGWVEYSRSAMKARVKGFLP